MAKTSIWSAERGVFGTGKQRHEAVDPKILIAEVVKKAD
jgi:hypothetical protein